MVPRRRVSRRRRGATTAPARQPPSCMPAPTSTISQFWLGALSYLHAKARRPRSRVATCSAAQDNLGIASLVYKWAPDGNPVERNLSRVRRVFLRPQRRDRSNGFASRTIVRAGTRKRVYQFMPRWRVGLRYAELRTRRSCPLRSWAARSTISVTRRERDNRAARITTPASSAASPAVHPRRLRPQAERPGPLPIHRQLRRPRRPPLLRRRPCVY